MTRAPILPTSALMIVTAQKPRRNPPHKRRQTAQPVAPIVSRCKLGKRLATPAPALPDDPEADARMKAFFARMIRPPGT